MRTAKSEKTEGQQDAARRTPSVHKTNYKRRYPIGAELVGENKTHFRVWAPKAQRVDVVLEGRGADGAAPSRIICARTRRGRLFFRSAPASAGNLYRFRLDEAEKFYPDPASRSQPSGPHGPSCVVDPFQFKWTDQSWRGLKLPGQIIYELHVGTFTPEGTWQAAAKQLAELAKIGITVIEMMPVAEFPGRFRLGLRRRRSLRAFPSVWKPGRSARFRRSPRTR